MTDAIGWTATAVFASSYFCRKPATLRRIQALAAGLWLVYGVMMGAMPVIVANVIVASLALASSWREERVGVDPATVPPQEA
jgi:hypothetical protein